MKKPMTTADVNNVFIEDPSPLKRHYERVVIREKPRALQLAFEWGEPMALPLPKVVFRRTG